MNEPIQYKNDDNRVSIEIDEDTCEKMGGACVAFVEVKRRDGKTARVWVTIRKKAWGRCDVMAQIHTRSEKKDYFKELKAWFVDWTVRHERKQTQLP